MFQTTKNVIRYSQGFCLLDRDLDFSPVLSQPEGVVEDLAAESTDEVTDSILDLGQLGLGLLGDLDHVELRVDIA